ncbi:MAG TPA: DUF2071 domain-containing protein [Candidatus Angelobacter sp.]|nr:DUF2071 domain-containing protein [Candidatus Angelobacter sp.]
MNTAPAIAVQKPRFQLPVVAGIIERRMLLNFRCEPAVIKKLLPAPFRPQLVHGSAIAGICLIRLGGIRPAFLPSFVGLNSENAAHRIAVEWDENGTTREGVFIPRRDTNARLNRLVGGTLFLGVHQAARFRVVESFDEFEVEMRSVDGVTHVLVQGRLSERLPANSVFHSVEEASAFFLGGSLGWSARHQEKVFDGLELRCREWRMKPLMVERVESSFFQNPQFFPPGSAIFDGAFLMRNIAHEWHGRGQLKVRNAIA